MGKRALAVVIFLFFPALFGLGFFVYKSTIEGSLNSYCEKYANAELRNLGEHFQYTDIPNLYFIPKSNAYHFNSMGMNDVEYNPEKGENTFRIMVLGDSVAEMDDFVQGDRTKLFHEALESALTKKSERKRIEVWNLGVRKYNTVQELLYFKNKFLKYKPDLVIVAYVENDMDPPRLIYDGRYSGEKNCIIATVPLMFPVLSQDSHAGLSDYGVYRFLNWIGYRTMSAIDPERYPQLFFKDERSMEFVDKNKMALMDLRDLSEEHGFRLVIAIFPMLKFEENRDPWLMNTVKKKFNALDLYEVFMSGKYDPKELRAGPEDLVHPNVTGHLLAAKALENYLLSGGFIP